MQPYATLDESVLYFDFDNPASYLGMQRGKQSLVDKFISKYKNNFKQFHIYSHALILNGNKDECFTLNFFGKDRSIFNDELKVVSFIKEHISDERLYSCVHYKRYLSLDELNPEFVGRSILKKAKGSMKRIKKSFVLPDMIARESAWKKLEELATTDNLVLEYIKV